MGASGREGAAIPLRSRLILAAGLLAFLRAPGAASPSESAGIVLPAIEVTGKRLTAEEILRRTAEQEERSLRARPSLRYWRTIRWSAFFGDSLDSLARRIAVEERAWVEERGGRALARTLRRVRSTWDRGELQSRQEEVGGVDALGSQLIAFRDLTLALRRGEYRFEILERRPYGGGCLVRMRYEPRSLFDPLPEGEAWIDTGEFVVVRQVGAFRRGVPIPFLLRSVERFEIERVPHGPLWVAAGLRMRASLRTGSLGGPRSVDLRMRLEGIEIAEEGGFRRGPARPLEDTTAQADRPPPRGVRPGHLSLPDRCLLDYNRATRLSIGVGFGQERPGRNLSLDGRVAAAASSRPLFPAIRLRGPLWGGARWEVAARREARPFGAAAGLLATGQALLFGRDPPSRHERIVLTVGLGRSIGRCGRADVALRRIRDRSLRSRSVWSILRGQRPGPPFLPIDPAEIVLLAGAIDLRSGGWDRENRLRIECAQAIRRLGGEASHRSLEIEFALRRRLRGGQAVAMRGIGAARAGGPPRQEWVYLGGNETLRGYPGETLEGPSGYHLGAEGFLNRDLVGWLPGVPDRGLGLEMVLFVDHGAAGGSRGAWGNARRQLAGATSVGIGVTRPIGLPGIDRLVCAIHRACRADAGGWRVRIAARGNPPGERDEECR